MNHFVPYLEREFKRYFRTELVRVDATEPEYYRVFITFPNFKVIEYHFTVSSDDDYFRFERVDDPQAIITIPFPE